MDGILILTGLALTTAFSFSVALLLGWAMLAGLLRLLPASTPRLPFVSPAPLAATATRARRPRVVVTQMDATSRKRYTVRVA